MTRKIRLIHVINSFTFGGAEAMLCSLLLRHDRNRFDVSVVALIDDLSLAGPVLGTNIPLVTMGMKPGIPDPRGLVGLARHIRDVRPAIVQTWMDHSNLIGGLAARAAPGTHVVWGIHHSQHVPGVAKRTTLMTVSACALLSRRLASRIVFCSEHARAHYAKRGFAADRLVVIPNGFDTETFRPDPDARLNVREELGLNSGAILIGIAARHDPVKDHANFLQAAALLSEKLPTAHFLLCGDKVDSGNATLMAQVEALGLGNRCHLLGHRRDVARIHAALDLATLSSLSEAFPLTIGEAMSCGVPCVATDVGDSALLIGPTGRVVPPSNPGALAAAWGELLAMDSDARRQLGLAARRRVSEMFDLGAITRRYEALYEELASMERRTGLFRCRPDGAQAPVPAPRLS